MQLYIPAIHEKVPGEESYYQSNIHLLIWHDVLSLQFLEGPPKLIVRKMQFSRYLLMQHNNENF